MTNTHPSPRLINRQEAANYCGVSTAAFAQWVRQGTLPKPVPGTNRWDIRAIDYRLDNLAGIPTVKSHTSADIEFNEMEAKIDARIAQRHSQSKKASR